MRRSLVAVLLLAIAFPATIGAQPATTKKASAATAGKKKKKAPCKATLADCPDVGCGGDFDPNLNRLKNIRSSDGAPTLRTLTWMKKLDDPESFSKGDSREELAQLGEGQVVSVSAYLLVAKAELGGESCNCGLQTPAETDNHLVLVSKATVDKFPLSKDKEAAKKASHSRELESITAEFTPRVRLDHPNFTREKVQPLINATPQKALLVRVTGPLLFDSEHFIKNHLVRVNNWEIHPVMRLEFCQTGNKCKPGNDTGWKSLDDLP
jgi:hypothetical protein